MSVCSAIQTDDRKVQTIVGTKDLAVAFCRRSHRQTRRPNYQCIQKLTPCNHYFPHSGPGRSVTSQTRYLEIDGRCQPDKRPVVGQHRITETHHPASS